MIKFLLVLLACFGLQTEAARFDPLLQPFVGRSQDSRIVRVLLTFKSQNSQARSWLAPIRSAQARAQVESMMIQNAKNSQSAFAQKLGLWSRAGITNQHYSLWLINGMILDLPVKELGSLATEPSINYVYANSSVHLISPKRGRWLAPSQMRDEPQFTYGLQKLMIPQLRIAKPYLTGKTVRVGVVDTGIDATHPDLVNKVIAFTDLVNQKTTPYDDEGHGTHVSGTIGGGSTSGTSIGADPDVRFISAKFIDKNGSGSLINAVLAMQWVADPDGKAETDDGAMVVNNSWGGQLPSVSDDPNDNVLCQAVEAWAKLGVTPVFAAGNAGHDPQTVETPGACPFALSVGATDIDDKIADFSSRGPAVWSTGSITKPDVVAPGVNIKSCMPDGKYAELSGTSMAAPHVTGVVALIYQLQPKITVGQLISVIKASAAKIGEDPNIYGAGRIDALKAAQLLGLR